MHKIFIKYALFVVFFHKMKENVENFDLKCGKLTAVFVEMWKTGEK